MIIEAIYQLDSARAIQRLLCRPSLDLLMAVLATASDGWFVVLIGIGLAWRTSGDRRGVLRSASRCLTVLAVTGVLVQVTKRFVDAPRPLQVLGPERVRVLLEPLHHRSFPSGHAAAVAALALWAWREPSVGTRWWLWLFAFLSGVARVYVGAHWVTDVAAGWLLGVAAAVAVCHFWPSRRRSNAGPAGTGMGSETPTPAEATEMDSC